MTADKRSPNPSLVECLRRSEIFAGLSPECLDAMARAGTPRTWPEGQTIFQRGDPDTYLLALTAGRVRLALTTAQGRELVLRHVGPNEVIGEFALIDGEPRSADATAVAQTTGYIVTRDAFLRVADVHPALGLALARHLCALLRRTNYQMESIALYDLQMRVARFIALYLSGTEDGGASDLVPLRHGLSQTELALVLGASRPKVNQVIQGLFADGILVRKGNDTFCARARLQHMVDIHGLDGD